MLDLACGAGRHALAAAQMGARVVAIDRDAERLATGLAQAAQRGLDIEWIQADLEKDWPELGVFDVVMVFNYLDRPRMSRVVEAVRPGGVLMMETFLEAQRHLGWGPQRDEHLLRFGEIIGLTDPLEVVQGREAFEPADNAQWAAVASVLARRRK